MCVCFCVTCVYLAVYAVEAVMKICGLGPSKYFRSGWNMYDSFNHDFAHCCIANLYITFLKLHILTIS